MVSLQHCWLAYNVTGLELSVILLPQLSECWDYGYSLFFFLVVVGGRVSGSPPFALKLAL